MGRATYRTSERADIVLDIYTKKYNLDKGKTLSKILEEHPQLEELEETIKKRDEIIETVTKDNERLREMLMLENTNVSAQQDQACDYLDRDSKEKLFCRHPNPPIKTRDLTPKACMLCQNVRRRNSQATQKKEEDKINRFHEQTKRRVHDRIKRMNETLEQEKVPQHKNCGVCGQPATLQIFNNRESMFLCDRHKNKHGFPQFGKRRL